MMVGAEWDKVRYSTSDFHGNQMWPICKRAKGVWEGECQGVDEGLMAQSLVDLTYDQLSGHH